MNALRLVKKINDKKPQTTLTFTDNWAENSVDANFEWNYIIIYDENASKGLKELHHF